MASVPTGVLKVLAVTPALLVSAVLALVTAALLPAPAAVVLLSGGLSLTALLGAGRREGVAVRLLYGARPPTPAESAALAPVLTMCSQGLGPPAVTIHLRDGQHIGARGTGRYSVLVTQGLIRALQQGKLPAPQAAAVITHAAGRVHQGLTRSDLAVEVATIPWHLLWAAAQVVARAVSWIPLVELAWRLRFVVATVTVVQSIGDGHPGVAALVTVLLTSTYLAPSWQRAWDRRLINVGDQVVLEHRLGPHLAAFLRRRPPTDRTLERIHLLNSHPSRPLLMLVTP